MKDVKGNDIFGLSGIEERILTDFSSHHKKVYQLTKRDKVTIYLDGSAEYILWNTPLIRRTVSGEIFINISGNDDMDFIYYGRFNRIKPVVITQTTKNRLNAFLKYYGADTLEVHSSKKLWGVWHKGKEIKVDSWYKLDTDGNLIKVC